MMRHETLFSGSTTQTSRRLRPQAWLPTPCGRPVRCQPRVARAVAATTAHDWGNCATASCRGAPAALRLYGAGVGAPVHPRAARGDPGGTLCPAPPPARVVPQCGHHVPCPPAPGTPTQQTSLHATERDTPRMTQARAAYQQRTATRDLRRVKCVDAAGVNLARTRLYGRAPRGERSVGTIPLNDGAHSTLRGALGIDGLQAVMTVEGATDADVVRTSVTQVLGPTLAPGDMVVLDHLSAHKAPGIQPALARRRARRL